MRNRVQPPRPRKLRRVQPQPTDQRVVARPAVQQIVPRTAGYRVVATETKELIVAATACDRIGRIITVSGRVVADDKPVEPGKADILRTARE